MINACITHTLLFASALQVLGENHEISLLLKRAVDSRDPEIIAEGKSAIESLSESDRHMLFDRFNELLSQLPVDP